MAISATDVVLTASKRTVLIVRVSSIVTAPR